MSPRRRAAHWRLLLLLPLGLFHEGRAWAQTDPAPPAGVSPTPQAAAAATSAEDQKLLEEIQQAAGPGAAKPAAEAPPAAAAAPPARGTNPFSNLFNPAMSANGLFLGSLATSLPGQKGLHGGLQAQELEVQLTANVDPYFSANLVASLPNGANLGLEEGYLTSIPQIAGFGFRAGKIKVPFGRENGTHTHALPFIEKSLVGNAVFGEEGLNQASVEATKLLPLPWYSLLTLTVLDGRDQVLLGSPNSDVLGGFLGSRSVFDLTDDSTLELGLSYAAGGGPDRKLAQAVGAHLTFKWRPARDAATSSAVVSLEGIASRQPDRLDEGAHLLPHQPAGFYGYVQWQLAQRWYVGARFEYLTDWSFPSANKMRQSAVLVLAPTEFSAFRLQVNATELPGIAVPLVEGLLQVNFTIGAHPAHSY
ncbi:MAG TPA: hypothetical protein VGK67_14415 [Myxococcales bacterium]|jgi:hypothetical protein